MMRLILLWVSFVGVILFGYIFKEIYNINDQIIWLILISIGLYVIYYHFNFRISEIEMRVTKPDYSHIKSQIEEKERHKPQHRQPTSLADGGAIVSWINEAHEILFDDYRWFGAVLNQHVSEPWAIEEINDTFADGIASPDIGRQYHVWYNACQIGKIQVTLGSYSSLHPERFSKNRRADVAIWLNYLNFVPYADALSLISQIILYTGSYDISDGNPARVRALNLASNALSSHLWEVIREADYSPRFDYSYEGPYELLQHIVDIWSENGTDPYQKWGGDR
ncbi:hypothetical protein ACFQ3K_16790 [Brucella gallinifaecis]|uniref:DUF1266 domain-containing protein n=1 Tax=Brucella gallinifaecis TaxID=215590 RepID=A0A502BHV0_9HYPH|nr:hypothetical protein [Brucella gallinifaecis]TPF73855.1 hypothetical protein FHY56_17675 [Brucella gallinifaecis]